MSNRLPCHLWLVIAIVFALGGQTGGCARDELKKVRKMDQQIPLYSLINNGASVYLARIEQVNIQAAPDSPGQQKVSLQLRIIETLWGQKGASVRTSEFNRPEDEAARLKFPDPVWGRVNVREGALILLLTSEHPDSTHSPHYVDEIRDPNDPVLRSVRLVLNEEKNQLPAPERLTTYLAWLSHEGPIVQRLFAAEALAKKETLSDPTAAVRAAPVFARVFLSSDDLFLRLNVGTWMWENIYPRTDLSGRRAIVMALLEGAASSQPDIERFSLDSLTTANPSGLREVSVPGNSAAFSRLQNRLEEETSADARAHIKMVIDALQHSEP